LLAKGADRCRIGAMSFLPRLLLFSLCVSAASAAVVRVEVSERSDVGKTGYEQIVGKLHFEIDPKLPGNAVIADVGLAPVNAAGKVGFSSGLRILKPKDDARSNGAAWVEIPNRGGKASASDWVVKHGFTVLNVGWEFDLPADKLRIEVPTARNADGSAIRGVVSATFTPDKPADEQTLTDLTDYPPVDLNGPDSRLIVRNKMAYPGGVEVPRESWSLKDNRLRMKGGFELGKTYEIFYLAEAPPVAGLGYAAIRDAVAWLKHDATSLAPVKHAYAFGSSQCGRFLRDFMYLGFNTDEQDRMALDGVMAHVAGAGRLVLNQRWSTPRGCGGLLHGVVSLRRHRAGGSRQRSCGGHSGQSAREACAEGLLHQHGCRILGRWPRGGADAHESGRHAGHHFPENVRSYFFAGTQHGASPFPPKGLVEGAPLANPVNANAVVTALRLAMHRWVSEDIAPPPSVHPKLSDGTLTPVADVRFPKVPGMGSPNALKAGGRVRNPQWPDGAGEGHGAAAARAAGGCGWQ
jgi:hypothetical protein